MKTYVSQCVFDMFYTTVNLPIHTVKDLKRSMEGRDDRLQTNFISRMLVVHASSTPIAHFR